MQYDTDIDNAIVDELASYGPISYLELEDRVVKLRGKTMSFETFNVHLKKMLKENVLKKDDRGRGKQVFYSLTEDAKKQRQLNILGVNPKQLLFRRIYEKLFFYEIYHVPLNIVSSQDDFNKILAELKVDIKDLHVTQRDFGDMLELEHAIKQDEFTFVDTKRIYHAGVSNIRIEKTEFWEVKKHKKNRYATEYTFTLPGASVDEFIKNDSLGAKFRRADIEEAFNLLRENGLIKPEIVFRGQTRFVIADGRLRNMIKDLKSINDEEWSLLLHKWNHFDEPTNEEKERMNRLLGEEEVTRIFKNAERSRYEDKQVMKGKLVRYYVFKNEALSKQEYKKFLEQSLIEYKSQLDEKVKKAKTDHKETIQEHAFLHDIIKIACPVILE
jgi:hypothetical protein